MSICAWETTFFFDSRTDVLEKVSKFLKQKMTETQPSDSCQLLYLLPINSRSWHPAAEAIRS